MVPPPPRRAAASARRRLLTAVLTLLWSGIAFGQPSTARDEPITPIVLPPAADARKLALGERLFGDVRLSGDNAMSCASCHDVGSNGAGDRRRALPADGARQVLNTPTVFNVALS